MATTKPRITVTLTKRQHEVLRTISECGGQPMSTFVSEMLEAALPTLERMAATFQKIKKAQELERAKFLESMDEAQAAIEPVVMEAVGQFDLFLGKMKKAAGVADAPARSEARMDAADAPAAAPAPLTNRGVTPTRGKARKGRQDKASEAIPGGELLKKKRA